MAVENPSPADFLPLPVATFHILMALADGDRHGYAIIQDIALRTGGEIRLSPYNPDFETVIAAARAGVKKYRNALRALAKL